MGTLRHRPPGSRARAYSAATTTVIPLATHWSSNGALRSWPQTTSFRRSAKLVLSTHEISGRCGAPISGALPRPEPPGVGEGVEAPRWWARRWPKAPDRDGHHGKAETGNGKAEEGRTRPLTVLGLVSRVAGRGRDPAVPRGKAGRTS